MFCQGGEIVNPSELAEWARSKGCRDMRAGDTCDHAPCRKVEQAFGLLQRLERFEGVDGSGQPVNGYIIKDQEL